MMPRMPSEPMNRRSGLGPAPEPGRRRVSTTPAGVTHPQRLDELVDVRVAASRSGRPSASRSSRRATRTRTTAGSGAASGACGRSCSSSAGPSTPAWMRAARDVRSISSTRSRRPRSRRDDAGGGDRARRGSTPPTTLEPPPYGMTARADGCTSRGPRRRRPPTSGRRRRRAGWRNSPRSARTTSRNDSP